MATTTTAPIPSLWARFYKCSDPSGENNPAFENVEIVWERAAINDLLAAAFSPDWIVTVGSMSVAVALGQNPHGLYEMAIQHKFTNISGWVYVSISGYPVLKPRPPANPNYDDKITGRLIKDALKTHSKDYCPRCKSKEMHYHRMALRCSKCKTIIGGC